MGICSSTESTRVATAKLILQDGKLQEFAHPIKVSYVLQNNPMCFICNSDEMDFDVIMSGISEDEELQLGQLYFALPLSRLSQPLHADDMAALAVKASSALMKSADKIGGGGGGGVYSRRKSVAPVVVSDEKEARSPRTVASVCGGLKRGRSKGSGKGRDFQALLSVIPE